MKGLILLFSLLVLLPGITLAQSELVTGKATPQEVYQKVAEAAQFLAKSGEKGLKEFENPRGKFVWKVSFMKPVPNSPYQVISDIFDDTTTLEQLNKISKRN